MIGGLLVLCALLAANKPYQVAQNWQDLSPRERYDAMRNYEQHESLPPDRQQDIEQRYQRWEQMPESERNRIRQNFERYEALPQDQREQFKQRYERWKQTPGK